MFNIAHSTTNGCLSLQVCSALGSPSLGKLPVKSQIAAGHALGDIRNLSVMHSEVLHHLVDGFESADVVALNFVPCERGLLLLSAFEYLGGFVHGRAHSLSNSAAVNPS